MAESPVLTTGQLGVDRLRQLLARYRLSLEIVPDNSSITASYWGTPEAGVRGLTVYARNDTPVHSVLHEACHVLCMDAGRRRTLNRDAGGDDLEEAAVCYLQIVLADHVDGVGSARLMQDMDAWGYSFRLGSARRWFEEDADDARGWLQHHGLLTSDHQPSFRYRN